MNLAIFYNFPHKTRKWLMGFCSDAQIKRRDKKSKYLQYKTNKNKNYQTWQIYVHVYRVQYQIKLNVLLYILLYSVYYTLNMCITILYGLQTIQYPIEGFVLICTCFVIEWNDFALFLCGKLI